jgi:hypothetical protein
MQTNYQKIAGQNLGDSATNTEKTNTMGKGTRPTQRRRKTQQKMKRKKWKNSETRLKGDAE